MSISRMVLEQVSEYLKEELIEHYRSQRPGYQNVLEDAQSLSEQPITARQAAQDYPFMLRSKRPEDLLPTGDKSPGTFYPESPATLGSKAVSDEIRKLAKRETKLSDIMGAQTETLTDQEKETASQTMSALSSELQGLEDMPNLTPGDLAAIAKRQRERTSTAAAELNKRLASQSSDPQVASLGFNPEAQLRQRADQLSQRYQGLLSKREQGQQISKDEASKFKSDYSKLLDDYQTGARRAATTTAKVVGPEIQSFLSSPEAGVDAPAASLSGQAATLAPIARVTGLKSARAQAANIARGQVANLISSKRDSVGKAASAAEDLATEFKVDPTTAKREVRNFGLSTMQSLGQDIRSQAAERARLSDPARIRAGARALVGAGLLPRRGK